jgi:hypothetical protein
VQLCEGQRSSGLLAIVLTGSLVRDEATFVRHGECWKLFGDAEFFLVFMQDRVLPSPSVIGRLQREIELRLLQEGLSGHVELNPVHTRYLRTMPPEILAYELRTYGQVVWGERQILSLIPSFSPSDIPLEDGWRMLCNRMVEFIEVIGPVVEKPGDPSPDGRYQMIKLYLDMATSFLLFQGAYAPTYLARAERLRALAAEYEARTPEYRHSRERGNRRTPDGSHSRECGNPVQAQRNYPFPLREFAQRVTYCTKLKLQAGDEVEAAAPEEGLEDMFSWAELVTYARELWRWELERLTGCRSTACRTHFVEAHQAPREGTASRTPTDCELMRRWMRRQPVRKRLRGWASALRRGGWHRSWRHWLHWAKLGWQASPRYWVYAAACELFFYLPRILDGDGPSRAQDSELRSIRSWLPMEGDLPGIGGNVGWRGLAADIAWNYRAFLKGTRS